MKYGIVVVWYNPDLSVVSNIKSYYGKGDYIYIVDNSLCNNEKLLDELKEKRNIKYLPLYKNYGIAKGLNVGIELAISDGCKWVVTMDQDSYWKNDLISIYKKYINNNESDRIAILAPQYETERSRTNNDKRYKQLKRVMQSGNMINCDIYKKCGNFLEKLFIDCVDYEYCYRVRKNGYSIIQCGEAVLIHNPAITKTKKIAKFNVDYGYASKERYYYQARNISYLIYEYKDIYSIILLICKFLKVIILFDEKGLYLKSMIEGISDFRKKNFGDKEICDGKR